MRIQPGLPVQAMKTYALDAPQQTHYRRASCREVDCPNYANGWRSGFDVTDPHKAAAAKAVRDKSGRLFTLEEIRGASGKVERVIFTFGPGQECFQPHRVPLERDPILSVRDGDWRGNPTGFVRVHTDPEDWVDDFANHQIKINRQMNQG